MADENNQPFDTQPENDSALTHESPENVGDSADAGADVELNVEDGPRADAGAAEAAVDAEPEPEPEPEPERVAGAEAEAESG